LRNEEINLQAAKEQNARRIIILGILTTWAEERLNLKQSLRLKSDLTKIKKIN
jgi:hypothetical protein